MDAEVVLDGYGDVYAKLAVTADTDGLLHKVLHRGLERAANGRHFPRVLEIGAHRFEHLPFVLHGFDEHILTDIREPRRTSLRAFQRNVVSRPRTSRVCPTRQRRSIASS